MTLDGTVSTFAGSSRGYQDGNGINTKFYYPTSIQFFGGNLFICDYNNHCIRIIDEKGNVKTFAGIPGKKGSQDGPKESTFHYPLGITIDSQGSILQQYFIHLKEIYLSLHNIFLKEIRELYLEK